MPNEIQTQIDQIINWCKANWVILLLVVIVIVVIVLYMRKKPTFKPVSRQVSLRKEFIDRNKLNISPLRWCYRGSRLMGYIKYLSAVKLNDKEKGLIDALELVIKPQLFGIKGIPDFFNSDLCAIVSRDNCDYDLADGDLDIIESTTFDKRSGIYYDRENKESYIKYLLDRLLIADDFENLSSIYYVKAQEQATIIPANAVTIQTKQLDLEAEKEKRKHLVS